MGKRDKKSKNRSDKSTSPKRRNMSLSEDEASAERMVQLLPPPPSAATTVPADVGSSKIGARLKITEIENKEDFRLEDEVVIMKEVKLPYAKQSHEIIYEKESQAVWVSQMTDSTLVRIDVDENGIMGDKQHAYVIGRKNAGLHNVSLSYKYEGHLWLSVQYMNLLLLVDVRPVYDSNNKLEAPKIVKILQVPTVILRLGFIDKKHYVGGPHCIREDKKGNIMACLKGNVNVADHGDGTLSNKKSDTYKHYCSGKSVCCDSEATTKNMEGFALDPDLDVKVPNTWAVWYVDPDKYDPKAADGQKGGHLFPCQHHPTMSAFDRNGNAWVVQDASPNILFVDLKNMRAKQCPAPFPKDCPEDRRITGPGIVAAPNGDVWFSQLKAMECLTRIDADTHKMTLNDIEPPTWARGQRTIHMTFHEKDRQHDQLHNRMYAITSSLVDNDDTDSLLIFNMDEEWKQIKSYHCIPMPTQQSWIHRIAYINKGCANDPHDGGSVVITELNASKVLQVKVNHDFIMKKFRENHVRRYTAIEPVAGLQ